MGPLHFDHTPPWRGRKIHPFPETKEKTWHLFEVDSGMWTSELDFWQRRLQQAPVSLYEGKDKLKFEIATTICICLDLDLDLKAYIIIIILFCIFNEQWE